MTAPVDVAPQLEPVHGEGSPPSTNPLPFGFPSSESLQRFQRYVAPLRRLGNQRTAWLGAALLFIGVFLPAKAANIPFINVTISASFWDFSKAESLLLILLALASAWLSLIHDYKWLWISGGVSLLFIVIEFFDALTGSYLHPSWAWLFLFPGVALVLASAALQRDPRDTPGNAVAIVRGLAQRAASGR